MLPKRVTGQPLGLDVDTTLEATHCFPFPSDDSEEEIPAESGAPSASAVYQVNMMRCLREVNIDHNTVGWYQSAPLGLFLDASFVDVQYGYHQNIRHSVVLIYGTTSTWIQSNNFHLARMSCLISF